MIKYSKLRDKLKVETLNGNAEDLAFFTHYLHNHANGVSKSFEKRAKKYFKIINEELSIVAEAELQAMLPIKWDIPFPAPLRLASLSSRPNGSCPNTGRATPCVYFCIGKMNWRLASMPIRCD